MERGLLQKEAAALAGVTPRTVRRWTAAGVLHAQRRGKQSVRYSVVDVAALVAAPPDVRFCPLSKLASGPTQPENNDTQQVTSNPQPTTTT